MPSNLCVHAFFLSSNTLLLLLLLIMPFQQRININLTKKEPTLRSLYSLNDRFRTPLIFILISVNSYTFDWDVCRASSLSFVHTLYEPRSHTSLVYALNLVVWRFVVWALSLWFLTHFFFIEYIYSLGIRRNRCIIENACFQTMCLDLRSFIILL